MFIFSPPFFADGCVVVAEIEEVTSEGLGAGDFGDAFYEGDIGATEELEKPA